MLLEPDALLKASQMDPHLLEVLQHHPGPDIDFSKPEDVAKTLAGMEKMVLAKIGPPEPALTEEERSIPMRDGYESVIKIHKPSSPGSGRPLIVLAFGGGWVAGSKHQLTPYARAMVRLFGAVVVNISYRLAPRHKFPVSQNDTWDSVKWLAAHASELGADPTKGFVVGGVSAGGGNIAVTTTRAVEEQLSPPITGQWLSVASIMDPTHVPEEYRKHFLAREQNANAPGGLGIEAIETLARVTAWDVNSATRFAILSPVPLDKMPPTYFQADGMDPLRDDALIYEEMLKEAGVKTKIDLYPGCPHAHFFGPPGLEVVDRATSDILVGMGWLLGKEIAAGQALRAMAPPSS